MCVTSTYTAYVYCARNGIAMTAVDTRVNGWTGARHGQAHMLMPCPVGLCLDKESLDVRTCRDHKPLVLEYAYLVIETEPQRQVLSARAR